MSERLALTARLSRSGPLCVIGLLVGVSILGAAAVALILSRRRPKVLHARATNPSAFIGFPRRQAAPGRQTGAWQALRTAVTGLGWMAMLTALAVAWSGLPGQHPTHEFGLDDAALVLALFLATWLVFVPRFRRERGRTSESA